MVCNLFYFYYISVNYEYKTPKELAIFEDSPAEEDDSLTPLTSAIHDHGEMSPTRTNDNI
jgi:hypothetical protein